jgi:hypothetical protein
MFAEYLSRHTHPIERHGVSPCESTARLTPHVGTLRARQFEHGPRFDGEK